MQDNISLGVGITSILRQMFLHIPQPGIDKVQFSPLNGLLVFAEGTRRGVEKFIQLRNLAEYLAPVRHRIDQRHRGVNGQFDRVLSRRRPGERVKGLSVPLILRHVRVKQLIRVFGGIDQGFAEQIIPAGNLHIVPDQRKIQHIPQCQHS